MNRNRRRESGWLTGSGTGLGGHLDLPFSVWAEAKRGVGVGAEWACRRGVRPSGRGEPIPVVGGRKESGWQGPGGALLWGLFRRPLRSGVGWYHDERSARASPAHHSSAGSRRSCGVAGAGVGARRKEGHILQLRVPIDNDSDGFTDYPDDPQCIGRYDYNELPQCSDGLDNDGSGQADYPDDVDGCQSPDDDLEADIPVTGCSDGYDNVSTDAPTTRATKVAVPSRLEREGQQQESARVEVRLTRAPDSVPARPSPRQRRAASSVSHG